MDHTVVTLQTHHNNNIVTCKAHEVSNNAELEAPAVARWAALVGYVKRTVLRRRLKVLAVRESLVSNCAKISGEPWTIKKKLVS